MELQSIGLVLLAAAWVTGGEVEIVHEPEGGSFTIEQAVAFAGDSYPGIRAALAEVAAAE